MEHTEPFHSSLDTLTHTQCHIGICVSSQKDSPYLLFCDFKLAFQSGSITDCSFFANIHSWDEKKTGENCVQDE